MLGAVADRRPCERRGALDPPEFDRYVAVDSVKAQLNIAHVLGFVAKKGHRLLTAGSTRKYVFNASLPVGGRQLYPQSSGSAFELLTRSEVGRGRRGFSA